MTGQDGPSIRTRGLTVGYDGVAAAAVPDVDIVGGAIWHVTGPNGAGKTALLKTLAGLLLPVSGDVDRVGARGSGPGGITYVHSVPYIFIGTVEHNLLLANPRRRDAESAAEAFGLSSVLDRQASLLSHGQQRRLALARAWAASPSWLLVDEPEGGLDDEAIAAWRDCAARAVSAGTPTLVIAAHRPVAFGSLATRVIAIHSLR